MTDCIEYETNDCIRSVHLFCEGIAIKSEACSTNSLSVTYMMQNLILVGESNWPYSCVRRLGYKNMGKTTTIFRDSLVENQVRNYNLHNVQLSHPPQSINKCQRMMDMYPF